MAKLILDQSDGNVDVRSFNNIANALGKMFGDEVYVRKSITIESSDAVIKSLEAVLTGVKAKAKTSKSAA
jgi:hypothetical protein